ncbi:alpha/beta hydrolase family protein [Chryseosolibacter indicus]|uniref:Prolyl oligopeptidase family serine peptidase n=1 Tax=Chryseosolibacter indicus TaxID=2782351 RepID=A0ABS5VWV4_9BACT|nr:prolyl oligopeptidase family serine peptidase [Chryseosolibacter indicus]MBT1705903.1 prolyl oligopeptidase family serine peptidase [Chryseosolibacter indicus]
MRALIHIGLICLFTTTTTAQNGTIILKERLTLSKDVLHRIDSMDPGFRKGLDAINIYRIVYLSDGLKVIGFLAEPKKKGKYPCIIANRGGRSNLGLWKPFLVAYYLARMASWGYVVVASQYRGSSDGGEGKDEFGGEDVNDVLNLIPLLKQINTADTTRIGMYGESRGGMMTFQALKRSCKFKAAVVVAGLVDAFDVIRKRPELEDLTFRSSIPNYDRDRDAALKARSALYWSNTLCRTTPLLIMQGSADTRVDASQSLQLVQQLYVQKHPVRFILFEGGDHTISQFETDMLAQCRKHFDYYLRDGRSLPKL